VDSSAKSLMERCVVLDVTFHRPGIRRKADLSLVSTDADKAMLGLTKAIVVSKSYRRVLRLAGDTRRWLENRSLPSPLKRGTYLVPLELIDAVNTHMDEVDLLYARLARKFLAAYPKLKEKARIRLKDQWDPRNYPEESVLRAAFSVERRWLDFGTPSEAKLGKALWEVEKKRAENTWREATEEIRTALRQAFRDLVGGLADRLMPNPDGGRKRLHASAVTKLTEFLDLFSARNITGDAELGNLVSQAREVLAGKSAGSLRQAAVGGEVMDEMIRVISSLDTLMEVAPRRAISFRKRETL
jgi:hypothetical protein